MKYLVTLELRIGELEKHTTQLVEAESSDLAELAALRGESHSATDYDEDGEWWDIDMIYSVDRVIPLTPDDAIVYDRITGGA
jgi:hypothetical protein